MSILDYFRKQEPASANLAKDRLKIVVAHERAQRQGPDYLPDLERDILQVLAKYVSVDADNVKVQLDKTDNQWAVLELNITLPDHQ
ncbi:MULTISPECIES: cell division topological specificity factor MinE [Ferrimonas]|uniref:Cell division topological specificity factor n=1 Tax=Ferrimonas sediminum TaxID=718193 RepID=A0A1G8WBR6_9GAMM|nr:MULTISPECIES: cell division topological specificity factor MinE [Ferrimonas]USD39731.1 cell division topological specificity factor MinE [Ferrimonas sp. SCSIO 43195]SDJ75664.1 cell division topological specificity factor MinE [Ferrimonas sediminum]